MVVSKKTREQVFDKYSGHCAYCGADILINEMQIDHVVPVATRGFDGLNELNNLNPACARCNRWKSVYSVEQFRQEIMYQRERLLKFSPGYRLAKDYGIIEETKKIVEFYYERC